MILPLVVLIFFVISMEEAGIHGLLVHEFIIFEMKFFEN